MSTLRETFTPLFSYVLVWLDAPAHRQQSFAEMRGEIRRRLDEQAELIKRFDIARGDYDAALFAAIAWADEVIVSSLHDHNPELTQQWKRSPLQVELFNTANAGEEFYENLNRLSASQNGVREIYYLCLCLGFRGRYYDDAHDGKLADLRRELSKTLPQPPPELLELEKRGEHVTPQPYAVAAPRARRVRGTFPIAYVILPLALLAAAGLYLLLPSGRTLPEVLADIHARTDKVGCAEITLGEFNLDQGILPLSGRIPGDDVRQQLRQQLLEIPEVKEVRDSFTIMPRPFCELVALLDPVHKQSKAAGFDVSISPQKGCNAHYMRGENLVFEISGSKSLGYVYADYFVADRQNVAHLTHSGGQRDQPRSEKNFTLGASETETHWEVQPPFGMELITVVVSSQPLISRPGDVDANGVYIPMLEQALAKAKSGGDVAAAYCFITTEE